MTSLKLQLVVRLAAPGYRSNDIPRANRVSSAIHVRHSQAGWRYPFVLTFPYAKMSIY